MKIPTFEQYISEHWITNRKKSITGWVTRSNNFIQVISNHGVKSIVVQMDKSLGNDPHRIAKLIQNNNVRVVDVGDKILLTTNSIDRAKQCVRFLAKKFPEQTQNKKWFADIISPNSDRVFNIEIDINSGEVRRNLW
jgi:hypothetical protein